ncbi:MAG: glycosyltransferase family 25 protein [Sedimentisphaerales bacterium]|nr:glycosyltransferase family 25 protein [Sedimentisphaerales bacterium]
MNGINASKYWKFFDQVYCISVLNRTERRAEAQKQFEKVGLKDKVEFVVVEKNIESPEKGIYDSHLACIRKGLQAGASRILIFEDDIIFDRFNTTTLSRCINFLSECSEWNTLHLGCIVKGSRKTKNPSVLEISYRCLTHAYVIHSRFAQVLEKIPWDGVPYDGLLAKYEGQYTAYPSFAFQSNSPTDNDCLIRLDKFRRAIGGLRRIQKFNEMFYHHKTIIIIVNIVILVLLLKWIIT